MQAVIDLSESMKFEHRHNGLKGGKNFLSDTLLVGMINDVILKKCKWVTLMCFWYLWQQWISLRAFQGQIMANLKAMDSDWFGQTYMGRKSKVKTEMV